MDCRKKRCSVCGCWFYPNARTRHSQKTCGKPECQAAQKQRTQSRWSRRNPNYWRARRLAEKAGAAAESSSGEVVVRPPPAEMARIPWEVVQEAFGSERTVILSFLVRVACQGAQEAMGSKPPGITTDLSRLDGICAQDAMDSVFRPPDACRDPPAET